MAKGDIVVGLDIGTTKICAIVGKQNEYGKLDILGMGRKASDGVARGVVTNISKTVSTITSAIQEASDRSHVNIQAVHVGIAGQHIKSLQHRAVIVRNQGEEEITRGDIDRLIQDVKKLVMQPGEEIVHIIPQEYTVDEEPGIMEPIGMAGVRLEGNFHVITGQVTQAKNIHRCVTKSNLQVNGVILEPIASAEAVLTEEEKEAGVALVDMGGGTTDMAIFQNGILRHTAVIPLGGNIITEDIREGCTVMKKQAEQMKIQYGSAMADETKDNEIITIKGVGGRDHKEISVRNLANIIQARVEEIFEHAHYELRASGYENKLIGGIVLTGGGAQLQHICQAVEYVTGLEARVGLPTEHLAKGMVDEVKNPMYATGIGLLLKALKEESPSMANTESAPAKPLEEREKERSASSKSGENLFSSIFRGVKDFFNDDVNDFK
jgi:cell division protein FtsA